MIRISRFFLPFLCCLTAPALAGTQTRWEVVPDSTAIVWNVREGDSHRDHIEMSGLRISAVLRYGVGADGSFRFERSIVWPMLRTIPNNTHGSLMRRFVWDVPRMLSVNENCLQQEKVRRIVLDGTMTVESDWTAVKGSLSLTRVLFPSVDEAAFCEKYILKNTGEKPLYVEIPRARSVIRTAPAKGVEGSYELVAEICGDTALMLAPRAEVAFGAFFSGRRSGDEALALNADAECAKRRALVAEWQRNLVLDTPDPVIDAMFAFAKIRAAESIYDTKGGLMHGPGGERFYAAIWANDRRKRGEDRSDYRLYRGPGRDLSPVSGHHGHHAKEEGTPAAGLCLHPDPPGRGTGKLCARRGREQRRRVGTVGSGRGTRGDAALGRAV